MTRLQLFKYSVYALLALDIGYFLAGDLASSAGLLGDDFGVADVFTVFAETLDTLAWVLLVLLFELETAVIPAARMRGPLLWVFSGTRLACYVVIVSAVLGYLAMWQTFLHVEPLAGAACNLADEGYFYFAAFDDYPALTAANCGALAGQPLALVADTRIVGALPELLAARTLAFVDVLNAVTWLVVVLLLEAEVYLHLRGRFGVRLRNLSRRLLLALSLVLIGCAVYWLLFSEFLDFWDALLWLVAFAFIEMNILDWQPDEDGTARP